ncbi:site-specific DNA-methyltransferase [Agrococcus sp. Marseille-Q4369]|uniref:DNA-methyltransferase n=1 Tax=Agrococcus sp. Marseille-Q4369 TaxID=2810513 RepID=UPI001B8D4989|nr:site-specific DNA-methyltransferase [Agrococcus sp. Marseille-Q4369]QUW18869.1 site-specific DNA-methyltransferase [Agrococcus sp. Marseille-Q4369]
MSVHYEDDRLTLLLGDAREQICTLPDRSVQTVVTSPPYFGLRDYGEPGQYGNEPTVAAYVERLVQLFREIRRVLADDGTVWLNLGDSYASKARGSDAGWERSRLTNPARVQKAQAAALADAGGRHRGKADGIGEKNLLGIPWRVAFALQDDGWVLRSDIIWAKPNPMPESVTDRPTRSHEYLFLLAKRPRYYYDAEAIAEPIAPTSRARLEQAKPVVFGGDERGDGGRDDRFRTRGGGTYKGGETANKRTVWTVPTVPFDAAHFATFPPALVRPCVLASSRPGHVVLDPFSGSGTTGQVALEEGRRYVGVDLSETYLDLSLAERFTERPLDLYAGGAA